MIIITSVNNIPVRLTAERWSHIINRHPELEYQREKVLETLAEPHIVLEGDFKTLQAAKHYSKTPLTEKYLVVIYKELSDKDGFVLTAYFTNRLSGKRRIIWKP
jgi:predicted phage-related endonuclease